MAKAKAKAVVVPKSKDDASKQSTKLIIGLIATIKTSAKELQINVHVAMAKIVVHAIKFGDVTLADRLIGAFGERNKTVFRTNDLRNWFEKTGPFRYDTESKGFKLNKTKRDEQAKLVTTDKQTAAFYSKLMKVAPWEAKKEPEYKGFDLMKAIKQAIAQGVKAKNEHGNHPKTKVAHLEELRAFVVKLAEQDSTAENDNETGEANEIEAAANVA